jgi:hypothetical protein
MKQPEYRELWFILTTAEKKATHPVIQTETDSACIIHFQFTWYQRQVDASRLAYTNRKRRLRPIRHNIGKDDLHRMGLHVKPVLYIPMILRLGLIRHLSSPFVQFVCLLYETIITLPFNKGFNQGLFTRWLNTTQKVWEWMAIWSINKIHWENNCFTEDLA